MDDKRLIFPVTKKLLQSFDVNFIVTAVLAISLLSAITRVHNIQAYGLIGHAIVTTMLKN